LINYQEIKKCDKEQTVYNYDEELTEDNINKFISQIEKVKEGLSKEGKSVQSYYKYHYNANPYLQIPNLISLYNDKEPLHS